MTINNAEAPNPLRADAWYNSGQYFNDNGHQIFYRDSAVSDPVTNHATQQSTSEKPVLLLLHGFPTCSWDFSLVWSELCRSFRLISLDFLGFGCSDKPQCNYSIFMQADITQALLRHLEVDNFHILSHDFGDTVALELLVRLQTQNKIQSLVLTNGGIFAKFHQPLLIQRLLASPLGSVIARMIGFKQFKGSMDRIFSQPLSNQQLEQYWQLLNFQQGKRVFPKLIKYMKERRTYQSRWEGALASTSTPLGLIAGKDDPISGELMILGYKNIRDEASVIAMENTGHYPHLENPKLFIANLYQLYDHLGIDIFND